MYLIGLTGGIASGKSVVGRRLAELGAIHIDADVLAREAVAVGGDALSKIQHLFGGVVIASDGSLDRAALGAIVFANPQKLAALNAITHPAVQELTRMRIAVATEADPEAVVVYDVPLLIESGRVQDYDLVVVAMATEQTRIDRMMELRGMTATDAARRIANQTTDADRLAIADVVIDSNGSLEETLGQVDALWARVSRSAVGKH
ncbi:MAG: dephospho-CoA kinase [Microbacteriaceae bacterium]|nr:dephospho-CoA kinase [Microbacteriaceae bacterium]